jgi:fructosamine-3-kinase
MDFDKTTQLEFGGTVHDVDSSVVAELPAGCRILSTEGHGVSFWANTARIDVVLADGQTEHSFFIKVLSNDTGRKMVHGEFESMKAIYNLLPDFVPKPIAWGTYQSNPDTHFFLCEYREMADDMPDPEKFSAQLALLHKNSKSPTGKFGFHITTCSGNLPQLNDWEDKWETYFAKSMRWALDLELKARGSHPEFNTLIPTLFDKVIPRLLRPLESEGRSVKPSLVHGDLWYANSGTDADTGSPLVFDACCFYAHNECKSSDQKKKGKSLPCLAE